MLGAASFLASAIHVYSVCVRVAGDNPGDGDRFVAVLITVSVELLALVAMLELRRGFRWVPLAGLLLGVGLTVAANLSTAHQNGPGWGWPETVAVAPAVLFLVVLGIVETRPSAPTVRPSAPGPDGGPAPSARPDREADEAELPAAPAHSEAAAPSPEASGANAQSGPVDDPSGPADGEADDRPDEAGWPSGVPDVQTVMERYGVGRTRAYEIRKQLAESGAR